MGMEGLDTVVADGIRRLWPHACIVGGLMLVCLGAIWVLL